MFNITKIKTDIKPAKIESLGNGMWYYNYDITESIEPGQNGENCTMYEFYKYVLPVNLLMIIVLKLSLEHM